MVPKVFYSLSSEEYIDLLKRFVTFTSSKVFNAIDGDYFGNSAHSLVLSLIEFGERYELDPSIVDELLQFINERLR